MMFTALDKDKDNYLSKEEMLSVGQTMGPMAGQVPNAQIEQGFSHMDGDKDGKITRSEATLYLKQMINSAQARAVWPPPRGECAGFLRPGRPPARRSCRGRRTCSRACRAAACPEA